MASPSSRAARSRRIDRPRNAKPGTSDWQLTYVHPKKAAAFRTKLVEGYCSQTSVRPGETITFHLSADHAAQVTIDIYRMGYLPGSWRASCHDDRAD